MGKAAAKNGDEIKATDTHKVKGSPPVPISCDFAGAIASGLSTNVRVNGQFAALVGSGAENNPHHFGDFVVPPSNQGSVASGSATVRINSKAAVRHGDVATTCHEPPPPGNGKVEVADAAHATVFFGD